MVMVQGRPLIKIGEDVDLPLVGAIAFGIIDRGSNVVQVRPISYCVLSCIMCSTDAGPKSRWRNAEYIVARDVIIDAFKDVVKFKGVEGIEAHIDTVGDPLLYPELPELIHELKSVNHVSIVSIQTHAPTLTYKLIDRLDASGLDRINLSIDSLDASLARKIQDTEWYNVDRIVDMVSYLIEATNIDVHLTPVLLPNINDEEILKIIEWGLRIGVGKKWPPFGIQKYVRHKRGRKPKGIREMSWSEFYRFLSKLSSKYKVDLTPKMEDFGMFKTKMLPIRYPIGCKVKVKVVSEGWMKSEKLAVTKDFDRVITVVEAEDIPIGSKLSVRIISNKHNIYLARPV